MLLFSLYRLVEELHTFAREYSLDYRVSTRIMSGHGTHSPSIHAGMRREEIAPFPNTSHSHPYVWDEAVRSW